MAEQVLPPLVVHQALPEQQASPAEMGTGLISADEYMEHYAHDAHEWVKGVVVKMSPISRPHDRLTGYLFMLFKAYFTLKPIGDVMREPFVMRLDATQSRREPDLQIVLKTNPGQLTDTAIIGPADICIEVVSSESVACDYGEKFAEYEKAGVREYWIVDPVREAARFNCLNEQELYNEGRVDADGYYQSLLLPGLKLYVETLWQEKLPDYFEIGQMVKDML